MEAVATDVAVRFLTRDELPRVADVFARAGEPLPDENAAVLALEKEGEIVAFFSFHRVLMLGLTHVSPEFQSVGASALKILAHSAEQSFGAGDSLFVPLADDESAALVQRMGCQKVGVLYRRDFV